MLISTLPSSISMTVTPDDSARLWDWGIMSLLNLTNFSTITLLHGNDATIYPC